MKVPASIQLDTELAIFETGINVVHGKIVSFVTIISKIFTKCL